MADEYWWSREQIENASGQIKNYLEKLREYKDRYMKLPEEITEAWRSVNAEELKIVIESDISKYEAVLRSLEDIANSLNKAAEDYAEGDSSISNLINTMKTETKLEKLCL